MSQHHAPLVDGPAGVTYEIGHDDVIVSVGGAWNDFATANQTPALSSGVVGRSLWDFLSGPTPRQVYRDLLTRVRQGHRVQFPFRCDSLNCARHMAMLMTPLPDGAVRFETTLVVAIPILGLHGTEPLDPLVTVCSWCKRVAVGPDWLEPEAAVARFRLLDRDAPVRLTHGICPGCVTTLEVDLEEVVSHAH